MKPADKAAGGGAGEGNGAPKRPRCPICDKAASRDFKPFCSRRCADVDLGRWLGESYVVEGASLSVGSGGEDGDED